MCVRKYERDKYILISDVSILWPGTLHRFVSVFYYMLTIFNVKLRKLQSGPRAMFTTSLKSRPSKIYVI